jgi:hypothetical protein
LPRFRLGCSLRRNPGTLDLGITIGFAVRRALSPLPRVDIPLALGQSCRRCPRADRHHVADDGAVLIRLGLFKRVKESLLSAFALLPVVSVLGRSLELRVGVHVEPDLVLLHTMQFDAQHLGLPARVDLQRR